MRKTLLQNSLSEIGLLGCFEVAPKSNKLKVWISCGLGVVWVSIFCAQRSKLVAGIVGTWQGAVRKASSFPLFYAPVFRRLSSVFSCIITDGRGWFSPLSTVPIIITTNFRQIFNSLLIEGGST